MLRISWVIDWWCCHKHHEWLINVINITSNWCHECPEWLMTYASWVIDWFHGCHAWLKGDVINVLSDWWMISWVSWVINDMSIMSNWLMSWMSRVIDGWCHEHPDWLVMCTIHSRGGAGGSHMPFIYDVWCNPLKWMNTSTQWDFRVHIIQDDIHLEVWVLS